MTDKDISKKYGVPMKVIKEMKKKEGWKAALVEELGVKEEGVSIEEEMEVSRLVINPRIILVMRKSGEEVRMRVKSNEKFMKGMKVRGVMIQDGLCEHSGRYPVRKGRSVIV